MFSTFQYISHLFPRKSLFVNALSGQHLLPSDGTIAVNAIEFIEFTIN